jgi:hypothetical protein
VARPARYKIAPDRQVLNNSDLGRPFHIVYRDP